MLPQAMDPLDVRLQPHAVAPSPLVADLAFSGSLGAGRAASDAAERLPDAVHAARERW